MKASAVHVRTGKIPITFLLVMLAKTMQVTKELLDTPYKLVLGLRISLTTTWGLETNQNAPKTLTKRPENPNEKFPKNLEKIPTPPENAGWDQSWQSDVGLTCRRNTS